MRKINSKRDLLPLWTTGCAMRTVAWKEILQTRLEEYILIALWGYTMC